MHPPESQFSNYSVSTLTGNNGSHESSDDEGEENHLAAMHPLVTRTSHQSISTLTENDGSREPADDEGKERQQKLLQLLPPQSRSAQHRPTTSIERSGYMLWLVGGYSLLALFSWITIVILVYRPITTRHYSKSFELATFSENTQIYSRNEQWYAAARVISAIVALLTISVTSAVCSSAAVIYTQHCRGCSPSKRLTVRQLMVLADKGWTDVKTYYVLLMTQNGWKRHGSRFLILAMLLNALGVAIQPLQQIFLSSETIKTPTSSTWINSLMDIKDQFQNEWTGKRSFVDTNAVVVSTRKALETTEWNQVQPLLWSTANISCDSVRTSLSGETPRYCTSGGLSLANISDPALSYPFWAQLPSSFHTGLIRQFLPRINSTAVFTQISEAEFPTNCENITGSYHVQYSNTTNANSVTKQFWSVEACMPDRDYRYSPWKPTRHRQDFSEQLYVQFKVWSSWEFSILYPEFVGMTTVQFHVVLNTTAGFFELPNYANGQAAGPLLEDDPSALCGRVCDGYDPFFNQPLFSKRGSAHAVMPHSSNMTNSTEYLSPSDNVFTYPFFGHPDWVKNKGPLLTIAIALFGRGSLIEKLLIAPDLYNSHNSTEEQQCLDQIPLGRLMGGDLEMGRLPQGGLSTNEDQCITNFYDSLSYGGDIISFWLANFRANPAVMSNLFTSAAFLANQAWMTDGFDNGIAPSLSVAYDHGANSSKPTISLAGIIFISILLGLDIIGLFAMALYSYRYPRWTGGLDSFTMMQIGTAMEGRVPMTIVKDASEMSVLDDTPGWVGDTADSEDVGRIGLGGKRPLLGSFWPSQDQWQYECYDKKAAKEVEK